MPMTPNTILVPWILHDVNNQVPKFLGIWAFVNVLQRFYADDRDVIYGIGVFFLAFLVLFLQQKNIVYKMKT